MVMKAKRLSNYSKIEKSLNYLSDNYSNKPSLKELANASGLSEYHFQKTFKEWAGISPKNFIQFLTKEHALHVVKNTKSLLDSSNKLNLSSQSRLYDLFVTLEAVTPGEYKTLGKNLEISYGIHETIFGKCLIAITKKGICHLSFIEKNEAENLNYLKKYWENAHIVNNQSETLKINSKIFENKTSKKPFKLFVKGTNFQIKVWEALINIPSGSLLSYEDVAISIDNKKAVRAVASAIANNPIAYIIPCHRVIKKIGLAHKYRWGAQRKLAMIGYEQAENYPEK